MKWIYLVLADKRFLWLLFIVNLFGTIYGYIWYEGQLKQTPDIFLIFVPDSPTATLFFVFVLAAFLMNKNFPIMESLAIVTLFKYGIWAVVMNIWTYEVTGDLPWTGYMLMISHGAMALQGLLYAPFYRIKLRHLVIAAVWTLHNDVIDYVFMQYPKYGALYLYVREIGYFTFWLSIAALAITYYLGMRKNRFALPLINN
ncbi:DUF1405 domain-containing protein [Falsibacillus pallidus]|uniref:Putative membrane protein YpjA n=1 Tax=Falsibacillus pallidus TaxID=493781 RepID=A0A370GIH2_9BACI|nr:DUF1405 domain-containing protein [Falsibacillus pallidus]RDI43006.1 putative membrane protein YpjA [Falsibacillus pallidus]